MFNDFDDDILGVSDALEALNELENNTDQAILAQRSSERIDVRTRVVIRPANSSERTAMTVEAMTADISDGGCRVLTSTPLMAGDVFWLAFDDAQLCLGSLFGRCMRCRMVQEDAFEVGFRFLNAIDLKNAVR